MRFIYIVSFVVSLLVPAFTIDAHESNKNTITVNGQGSIAQPPDLLKFTIAVEQRGLDSKSLSRAVNKNVGKILDMLTDNGVQEKDIQAMAVNLYPWYERELQNNVQKGFVFSRNINVTLRDFTHYPSILESLLEMDATRIEGFRYELEDQQSAYLLALKLAMRDAKKRAKELMTTTQKELGEVINITEASSYRALAQSSRNMAFSESTQYMPGTNAITARLAVTFQIK